MGFAQKLAGLMKDTGTSSYRLAKEVEVRTSTVTGWLNGRAPQLAHLKRIADYFCVSTDYLTNDMIEVYPEPLGKNTNLIAPAGEDAELHEYLEDLRSNPEKRMFFSLTKHASKEDVEAAVRIVEAFLKGREGEE